MSLPRPLLALLLCTACGSVLVPEERFYRLALPPGPQEPAPLAGVLRVHDLQLGHELAGDRLLIAEGPVALRSRDLHRWIAPLDRLVTDALVQGLSRSLAFTLVKGPADAGSEDLQLQGRILDFQETLTAAGPRARVALELWLQQDERLLCRGEFAAEVDLSDNSPNAAATGLSQALATVLEQLLAQLRTCPTLPPAPRY